MKSILRGLALTVALIVPAVSQAELVFDNFVTGQSGALPNTITSTVTTGTGVVGINRSYNARAGISGSTASNFTAGLDLNSGSVGAFADWTLSMSSGFFGPGLLGYNHYLVLKGLNTVGDWSLKITATGSDPNQGVMTVAIADGTTGDKIVDLTGLSHVGSLNGLTALNFRATVLVLGSDGINPNVIAGLSSTGFAAVPEPTSMALLGLTAVGGFFANRRRKKTVIA